MKKYVFGAIAIVVILLAFAGCQTPVAKVGSDPVTLGLQVTNKGDQAFNCNQTFAVDKKDVTTTVAVGETVNLQSNTHDPSGTVFTCYITPPTSVDQPDPGNGNFAMTYGYWSNSAHVTCDNDCNKGYPTESVHYTGNNWKYTATFAKPQSEIYNSVVITTGDL
tara:strand:+ start:22883 stop:23374 length:492 start_codon:yes stop_codon:yes gene_type:complete